MQIGRQLTPDEALGVIGPRSSAVASDNYWRDILEKATKFDELEIAARGADDVARLASQGDSLIDDVVEPISDEAFNLGARQNVPVRGAINQVDQIPQGNPLDIPIESVDDIPISSMTDEVDELVESAGTLKSVKFPKDMGTPTPRYGND